MSTSFYYLRGNFSLGHCNKTVRISGPFNGRIDDALIEFTRGFAAIRHAVADGAEAKASARNPREAKRLA